MSYKKVINKDCEYFPCHGDSEQNCLFCYCPLYFFKNCGGDPKWAGNIKDCSACVKNHDENSYDFIMTQLSKAYKALRTDGIMLLLPEED